MLHVLHVPLLGIFVACITSAKRLYADGQNKYFPEVIEVDPSNYERIFKGKNPESGQFPFAAFLGCKINSTHNGTCSGSIIDRQYILTAGHCLYDIEEYCDIVLGSRHPRPEIKNSQTQIFKEQRNFMVHPCFRGKNSIRFDIGIVKLDRDIEFTSFVQPIDMQLDNLGRNYYRGKRIVVMGFGYANDNNMAGDLLYTWTKIIPTKKCGHNRAGTLCSYSIRHSTPCLGDSGGPLLYYDEEGVPKQFALVSAVKSMYCDGSSRFTTNVKLSTHYNWIWNILEDEDADVECRH